MFNEIISDNILTNHRTITIMDNHNIVVLMIFSNSFQTIENRFLTGGTPCYNILQFRYIKLLCIRPEDLIPSFQNSNTNLINIRVLLEGFQRIDNDWFIINI